VLTVEERARTAEACGLDIVEEGVGDFHGLAILSFMFIRSDEPVYIPNPSTLFHRIPNCEPAARTLQMHHQYE